MSGKHRIENASGASAQIARGKLVNIVTANPNPTRHDGTQTKR